MLTDAYIHAYHVPSSDFGRKKKKQSWFHPQGNSMASELLDALILGVHLFLGKRGGNSSSKSTNELSWTGRNSVACVSPEKSEILVAKELQFSALPFSLFPPPLMFYLFFHVPFRYFEFLCSSERLGLWNLCRHIHNHTIWYAVQYCSGGT